MGSMKYLLFTIDLPVHPVQQTKESTSLRHLQISTNYPFTILLPVRTIKHISSLMMLDSALQQVSLSSSHLQLPFYYFQALFAPFLIRTSLSSFLLPPASAFFIFISSLFPSGTTFKSLPSWFLTHIHHLYYHSFPIHTFICNYSHIIHSWKLLFIHFSHRIVCARVCYTLETQR